MTVHGVLDWLTIGQLAVAGLAAMLVVQQLAVWRWEGGGSPARHVATTVACAVVVLLSNTVVLSSAHVRAAAEAAFLVRSTALAALTLSVIPLALVLTDYRPPRVLSVGLSVLVVARLTLLIAGRSVYRHTFSGGIPQYGPLSTPTGLVVIVTLLSYLVVVAVHGHNDRERLLLACGILGSIAIALASFITSDARVGEVLTGYLTLPALGGIAALVWMRQAHAHRDVRRFAERQHALAELGQVALTEPFEDLHAAAESALARYLPASRAPLSRAGAARRPGRMADEPLPPDPHEADFVRAIANVVDAAQARRDASAELEWRVTHDELTDLPNRRLIRTLIDGALQGRAERRSGVAVAFCNLDRFKTVNDAHGHPSGDEILRLVADRLRDAAWPCDSVGRFGSDEFVVICADATGADSVDSLSDRIHGIFQRPIQTDRLVANVTASVGVVVAAADDVHVDPDTLLRDAVTAVHDAKSRGAATGRFRRELRSAVVYRADIEQRLVGAVERGEIIVHYQPVVDVRTSRITGFEALARWAQRGRLVLPSEWIPVAESTDVIHEVGEHVLLTAARQAAVWQQFGVTVSVNVSARQLPAARLERAVLAALQVVPASSLVLEVTESMALDEVAQGALHRFREAGIRTALDDFGTGFSALASVARLPIDIIKIDQSITKRINHPDGTALVGATMAIARALGLTVVAEGVETPEHHDAVQAMACDQAQGHLYSPAVDAAAATAFLRSGSPLRAALSGPHVRLG